MAVSRRIHERPAGDALGRRGERGVRRDRFETVRIAAGVGRVEVVPDRDPVEAELLDPPPQRLQVVDRGVLQSRMDTEPELHGTTPIFAKTSVPISSR